MGKFQEGSFRLIQEYFQQKNCRFCSHPFTSEGIQLVSQELGHMVVRVGCSSCGRPLGIAIVGTKTPDVQSAKPKHPPEWTRKDKQRLSQQPAITYDDVLAAHEFFADLGADWNKHLPKYGQAAS